MPARLHFFAFEYPIMGFFQWLAELLFGKRTSRDDEIRALQRQVAELQRRGEPGPSSSIPEVLPAGGDQPPRQVPKPGKPVDLSAEQFLPIQRDEMVQQAKKISRWGPWFGRRDVIPPTDDQRTKLVDRALVTHGLLTPEQLNQIHEAGAEMERIKPSLMRIEQELQKAGQAAVDADKEQRSRIKEQKKAEAAKRKKQREDEIAWRRANDIVFLGRGVSGRLGDRTSVTEKLAALAIPVLATPVDLARALNLSIPKLRWLAFHTEVASRVHYVQFTVPKKSGGTRNLCSPHRTLRTAQRWILDNIVSKLPTESQAHGFLAGRSILSNAQQHIGKDVVVNVDLEGFFPNITFPRVRSVFHRAGYSPAVATILALLCTECPRRTVQYDGNTYHVALGPRGLPQGACTSPGLSNQVARRLDRRLTGLAAKMSLTYTRYADDITFSGGSELKGKEGYLMARVRHLAQEEGFLVNEKKNRVLRRNAAQKVTGLVVNERPNVSRKEIRRVRAILHRAKREGLESQNREQRPHFRSWLEGKIAFINMVRPELGQKLKAQLQELR